MKKLFFAAVFTSAIVFSSCSDNAADEKTNDSTDLEVLTTLGGSNIPTNMSSGINFTDENGKRQGKWVIYGKMSGDAAFNPTAKFEEGEYKDGLKEGEWTEYKPDGTVKRKVNLSGGKEVK
ncbi:MAG: hypothetical protein ABIQ40_16320 [Bacteroidia bacterium]